MRMIRISAALIIAALIVATPILYAKYRKQGLRNFKVVEEGVLYRSAQLTPEGYDRIIHDYQIKSVISLRHPEVETPNDPPPDRWEENYCRSKGVKHYRVFPGIYLSNGDDSAIGDKSIDEFLSIVNDPKNHPILVHCFRGVHRTGHYCWIFRVEYSGWSKEDATQEMIDSGYTQELFNKHTNIAYFFDQYKPRRLQKLGK